MKARVVHDRALLLYGCKRNEVLNLAEIEQYGLDSFADADYVSIYGMPPREWSVAASVYLVARLLSAYVTLWVII